MRRKLIILVAVLAIVIGGWLLTGGFGRAVESRIESQLVARGLPQPMAACMAGRMADRLTVRQLRKLAALAPEDGDAAMPHRVAELLERVRRIDDPEIIEVTASAAAVCAFTSPLAATPEQGL